MVEEVMIGEIPYTEIRPLICGQEVCKCGHSFGPTTRDYYLLHYIVSGSGRFSTKNGTSKVEKGNIFIIRPYEETYYQADEQEPWHYIWIGFDTRTNLSKYFMKDCIHLPQAEHIFRGFIKSSKLKQGRELFICSKIYELLSQIEEALDHQIENSRVYIEQTKNYIAANYMKEISIERLADKVGLNRSYFSRLFKQQEGLSPQQYLVEYRLEKAAELIGNYHYTPGEAAINVGYTDYFNFSKMFKKKYGIGPKYYQS